MAPKLNTTGEFYPTYRDANARYHPDTFTCAEATVSQLLKTVTTADHPGMLLGKVQSGKTRAFISILALAFDNAYDIAIVLSKNSKALIAQTIKDFFEKYSPEARALLNELLEKNAEHGNAQFVLPDVLRVPPLSDHGTILQISAAFGGAEKLREAVTRLQNLLYVA